MKTEKKLIEEKNRNRERLRSGPAVDYMQKQFPWFSENEIQKAIELKGPHLENVVSYLDDKSGTPTHHDDDDY
jgi:hypothetical protein